MEIFSSNKNGDSPSKTTECFECNICSDSEPNEPVVTLCGHLYCWPCIYQWLHRLQTSSEDHDDHDHHDHHHCPVCKAEISDALLVPLYGRGLASSGPTGLVPRRPAPPKLDIDSGSYCVDGAYNDSEFSQHFVSDNFAPDSGSETPSYSYLRAAVGMFGNPNSYPAAGEFSPRIRRRETRAERSLHRVCFFLLCCLIMFLVFL